MRTTSVTFRGKEVQSPFRRKLVVVLVVVMLPIFFIAGSALLFCFVLPFAVITQPFFKLFGRTGNFRKNGNRFDIKIDRDSFRKYDE